MAGYRWKGEEDDILRENYTDGEKEKLLKLLPKRSWVSIISHANMLKIERKAHINRFGNLSKLLEETPEAYYWMGFLLADGYFNYRRMKFTLCEKDREQVVKFGKFVEYSGIPKTIIIQGENKIYKSVYISIQDVETVPMLKKKFDIRDRKSYNPPSTEMLVDMTDDLFCSFIIGFIDGDGCIKRQNGGRPDSFIRIKCHRSWENFLQNISNKLADILKLEPNKVRDSKGYSSLGFTNNIINKFLKNKTKNLSLPVLERKWSVIDETFVSRIEKSKILEEQVYNMFYKDDMRQIDITRKLTLPQGHASAILKRIRERRQKK